MPYSRLLCVITISIKANLFSVNLWFCGTANDLVGAIIDRPYTAALSSPAHNLYNRIDPISQSCGLRSGINGLSHGRNKCPPGHLFASLRSAVLSSPANARKKQISKWISAFLVREAGLEPARP